MTDLVLPGTLSTTTQKMATPSSLSQATDCTLQTFSNERLRLPHTHSMKGCTYHPPKQNATPATPTQTIDASFHTPDERLQKSNLVQTNGYRIPLMCRLSPIPFAHNRPLPPCSGQESATKLCGSLVHREHDRAQCVACAQNHSAELVAAGCPTDATPLHNYTYQLCSPPTSSMGPYHANVPLMAKVAGGYVHSLLCAKALISNPCSFTFELGPYVHTFHFDIAGSGFLV
jgi:hypothetical protein